MPAFNLQTKQMDDDFLQKFSAIRKAALPQTAVHFFNHYYKLSINTQLKKQNGPKEIEIGANIYIQ